MVSVMDVAKPHLGIWTQHFLSDRSLQAPDGRPLYAYRTSDQEYAALSELLKNYERSPRGLDSTTFTMAWLLYAAEWWKRSYEGDKVSRSSATWACKRFQVWSGRSLRRCTLLRGVSLSKAAICG